MEQYYSSLDWTAPKDARAFLAVVEMMLQSAGTPGDAKERLRALCARHGLKVEGDVVQFGRPTAGGEVKNLIFAADGPKPELVLVDSVNNTIRIVKNAEYCLVYDRPILRHGLSRKELVDWWLERRQYPRRRGRRP